MTIENKGKHYHGYVITAEDVDEPIDIELLTRCWSLSPFQQDIIRYALDSHWIESLGIIHKRDIGQPLDPFLIDAKEGAKDRGYLSAWTIIKKAMRLGKAHKDKATDIEDIISACSRKIEINDTYVTYAKSTALLNTLIALCEYELKRIA